VLRLADERQAARERKTGPPPMNAAAKSQTWAGHCKTPQMDRN